MPLITCPDCGRQVSDRAATCASYARPLGGQALPADKLDGRLPAGKCIVVAPCTAKELAGTPPPINVTPANPGPQGYVIQPAAVRDWPDYKTRCNGAPFSENLRGDWYGILSAETSGGLDKARQLADRWVAVQKRHFDWMLRAKINMAWNRTNIKPSDARDKTTGEPSTRRNGMAMHKPR